jgi:hypothetical protein
MERRNFLKQAAAAAAGWKSLAGRNLSGQTKLEGAAAHSPLPAVTTVNGIGPRKFGRADAEVSIIGIGGYHIGLSNVSEAESIRIVKSPGRRHQLPGQLLGLQRRVHLRFCADAGECARRTL